MGSFHNPPRNNLYLENLGYEYRSLKNEKRGQAWHGGAVCAEAALPTQGGSRPGHKDRFLNHRKDCILVLLVKKGQGALWARDTER